MDASLDIQGNIHDVQLIVWEWQEKVDTKIRGFYKYCFSNSIGETNPSAVCIRFVL